MACNVKGSKIEWSTHAPRCLAVTPHHLATQSAVSILRQGGTAMEAMVAAAATIAVVYPDANSIGGDGFWLIVPPQGDPIVIESCGAAGSLADEKFFHGLQNIPARGPKAANTVAGAVGGWQAALDYASECGYETLPINKLLSDAIHFADFGISVSETQSDASVQYLASNLEKSHWSEAFEKIFFPNGKAPEVGDIIYQKDLAKTLRHLADNGLDSFYRGDLAKLIADDMAELGLPINESDLANYRPVRKTPLRLQHTHGELYSVPPPTQGLVSLSILGMLDKLKTNGKDEGEFIHTIVEATKEAFVVRDNYITDPKFMKVSPEHLLSENELTAMANNIDPTKASSKGKGKGAGDTVWLGVMDDKGFSVSYIQSIYMSFGSTVVLPKTGILWQNRGVSYSLDPNHLLAIKPGKKPFHTLNPAAAKLNDGRTMIYGTMGGDGQSQTLAAIFHRYVVQNMGLQESVTAPRWLFGRMGGDHEDTLKLENRFSDETVAFLAERGHDIVMLPAFSPMVGHAGALVRLQNGMLEGAFDPRSDGIAAGF